MRSEIERSIHLVLNNSAGFPAEKQHLNLGDPRYATTLSGCMSCRLTPICTNCWHQDGGAATHDYGVSTNANGYGYGILRCGAPLKLDGRYNETKSSSSPPSLKTSAASPAMVTTVQVNKLSSYLTPELFTFSGGYTDQFMNQPYVETDSSFKLVKLVDPTAEGDDIKASYWRSATTARPSPSKTSTSLPSRGLTNTSTMLVWPEQDPQRCFLQNITSDKVRFVVDGSGSMSACVLWGQAMELAPVLHPRRGYDWRRRNCAFTRMESLQKNWLLLEQLPDDTRIGCARSAHRAGSTTRPGMTTAPSWCAEQCARQSATEFVYSLMITTRATGEEPTWQPSKQLLMIQKPTPSISCPTANQ